MLRELLKEGGLYTIATILTRGVSLLLIPFYTVYFTTEEYGIVDILSVFGNLINGIFSLQIYEGLARYSADPKTSQLDKNKFLSTSLYITLISYTIFLFLVFIFQNTISKELLNSRNSNLLLLCSIALMVNNIFYFLSVYIRFQRKSMVYTLLTFINSIGNILLILILVFFYNYSIEAIFIATIVIGVFVIAYSLYYLRKNIIFSFSTTIAKKLFTFSLPLIPATLAYTVLNVTDRWFIKEYLGFDELGVYGIGYKFSSIVIFVLTGLTMAISPLMYQKYNDPNAKRQLSKLFNYFTHYGMFFVFILSMFSYETLYVFTNPQYYDAQYIMPIFYYLIGISGLNLFSLGLKIEEKTKLIAWFAIIAAIINLLLNMALIPKYYLIGAAVATLLGTLTHSLLTFIYSLKYYPFQHQLKLFFMIIATQGLILFLMIYFELSLIWKIAIVMLYGAFLFMQRKNEIMQLKMKLISMLGK